MLIERPICRMLVVLLIGYCTAGIYAVPSHAQHSGGISDRSSFEADAAGLSPHAHGGSSSEGWEGSSEGIAYSERNHHIAGWFVILMGSTELTHALRLASFRWARVLLPVSMTGTGLFLLLWSDHEAWPVGSMSFTDTFLGQDHEIIQHKIYGLLAVFVGMIEFGRRLGHMGHAAWATPLPLMAIAGGFMLFSHSHGMHPSATKIAVHHTVMGTLAITAGSSKLWSGWLASLSKTGGSKWELLWACLILLIGAQLLFYSE